MSRSGAVYELASVLERGGHVGLLVDQKFISRSRVRVTFFGRPVYANPLLAKLARQFDCPVHGARMVRLADGDLCLDITGPLHLPRDEGGQIDVQGATAMVTGVIEDWIREYPEQWLWLHKRWALP